jgi:acetyl esterase/lipase
MTREVAAAIGWTLENAGRYGGDPQRVVVAGHSSGGHLVSLAVTNPRFLEAHDHTRDELCGALYISGGYDLHAQYAYEQTKDGGGDTELMRTMVGVAGGIENFSAASPINYVRRGLPPTLILHGDEDQTIPVEMARAFHQALQEAGSPNELKVYPGRGHSELLFTALTEERAQIVADIAEFVHAST